MVKLVYVLKRGIAMEILYMFEKIRNPFLDAFFSVVTRFGEETFFIVFGLIFFWCINKKQGYYLLSIGFIGTILNQILKLAFRIPRPWVLDKKFTIVESARSAATGYSFPSGHTQSSVGVFGGIGRVTKNLVIRIISIVLCVLVPISRLYLGVHTPLDVGVSVIISLILVFGLLPIVNIAMEKPWVMRALLLFMVALALGLLCFSSFYNFPSDVDKKNLEHGIETAYKMLGCTLGVYISYEIDQRFVNFDTKATFWAQVLKLVIGLIPLLLIKEGLKYPLELIFKGNFVADGIRYFLLVIFAAGIWPMTFKFFGKLFVKK